MASAGAVSAAASEAPSQVVIQTETAEIRRQQQEGAALVATAQAITVADDASKREAVAFLRGLAGRKKSIEALFKPIKQAFDTAKGKVLAQERSYLTPVAQADTLVRQKVQRYDEAVAAEQARVRALEQARIDAEHRARLAAAEDEALLASFGGDVETQAEASAQLAVVAAMPVEPAIVAEPEKVDGFGYTPTCSIEAVDVRALVLAIARPFILRDIAAEFAALADGSGAGVASILLARAAECPPCAFQAVAADTAWLRKQALAMGEDFAYPGVTVKRGRTPRVTA